jgi:hypothetical protein
MHIFPKLSTRSNIECNHNDFPFGFLIPTYWRCNNVCWYNGRNSILKNDSHCPRVLFPSWWPSCTLKRLNSVKLSASGQCNVWQKLWVACLCSHWHNSFAIKRVHESEAMLCGILLRRTHSPQVLWWWWCLWYSEQERWTHTQWFCQF